jgi:replicative DNA helicase
MPLQSSASSSTGSIAADLEQLLLGAILTQSDVLDEIADRLKPEHFSIEAVQNIYKVVLRLYGEGREASPVTVSAALGNTKDKDYMIALACRAKDMLEDISHSVPGLANEVIDLANRRALLAATDKLRDLAASPSEIIPTGELQARLEALVVDLPETLQRPIKTAGDLTAETFAAAEKIYETGIEPGIRTGFTPWDQLVGPMMGGDLVVIGGATSSGKTSLAQQLAFEVAQGKPVLVHSMEMSARQWNDRYISQITGIPVETLEVGPFTSRDFDMIETARRDILSNLKMVISDQKGLTPAMILSNARRVKRRFGLSLLVLDHLQFIRPNNPKKEGPDAIAETVADIKHAAQLLDVPVLLISHLNRDTSKRDNYRPVLSDLFGSSAIEKDADTCVFVHRLAYWLERAGPKKDEDPIAWQADIDAIRNDAEFILGKRRRGTGAGSVKVGWQGDATMFYAL